MITAPTASTASAVTTITTTGRRYQASATWRVATGCESRSKLARGRGAASPAVLLCSGYSPGRIGTMPESSSASSDQASAGAGRGSTGISDLVVASATVPAAGGATAGPRGQLRSGRGDDRRTELFRQGRGDRWDAGAAAHQGDRRQIFCANPVALQYLMDDCDESVQRLTDRVVEFVPRHPDVTTVSRDVGGACYRDGRREL